MNNVFRFLENDRIFYFDSLGHFCWDINIKSTLEKAKKPIHFFQNAIQEDASIFCGLFTLCFLLAMDNGISPEEFMSWYDQSNLRMNEDICTEAICQLIRQKQIEDGLVDHIPSFNQHGL